MGDRLSVENENENEGDLPSGPIVNAGLSSGDSTGIVRPVRVALVAELADAPDLGSGSVRSGGSSPLERTIPLRLRAGVCGWYCSPAISPSQGPAAKIGFNGR